MKKPVKIVISIVLLIAILIIGISLFFPAVIDGFTSGTFGKAEKYHKSQMTEKDVQLRSEFTADTGQLRGMIQGLIYFSLFTLDLSNKIDSCVHTLKKQGMAEKDKGYSNILVLSDYSEFIKNNTKTLGTTISMLTGFYLKDESDQSADVERNLRAFGSYVKNLNEKDSILEIALVSMDNYMLTNKTLIARKTEISNLKGIRDQLLLGSIELSGVLQDKALCATLCSYAISSQQNLNAINGQQNLNAIGSQDKIKAVASQDKLDRILQSTQLALLATDQVNGVVQAQQVGSSVKSAGDLGFLAGSIIVYDKPNMQFVVGNVAELQKIFSVDQVSASLSGIQTLGNISAVAVFSQQGLNLVQSSFDLANVIKSQDLGLTLSASQLGVIVLAQGGIGSVSYGSGFIGFVGQLNNQNLGNIVTQ